MLRKSSLGWFEICKPWLTSWPMVQEAACHMAVQLHSEDGVENAISILVKPIQAKLVGSFETLATGSDL
jgi:hypothetical protein